MNKQGSEQAGSHAPSRVTGLVLWLLAALLSIGAVAIQNRMLATARAESPSEAPSTSAQPGSGIFGAATSAFGNAPVESPPPTECVKVFDAAGKKVVARGLCTGTYGSFRVPLPPGKYIVEFGGGWHTENGVSVFRPYRQVIVVKEGSWLSFMPNGPSAPLP